MDHEYDTNIQDMAEIRNNEYCCDFKKNSLIIRLSIGLYVVLILMLFALRTYFVTLGDWSSQSIVSGIDITTIVMFASGAFILLICLLAAIRHKIYNL